MLHCWTISTSTVIKSADVDRREINPDRLARQTSEYINARGVLLLVRNLLNDCIEHIDDAVLSAPFKPLSYMDGHPPLKGENDMAIHNITADDLVTELARQAAVASTEYHYAYLNSASKRKIGILRNEWTRKANAHHAAIRAVRYLQQQAIANERALHPAAKA